LALQWLPALIRGATAIDYVYINPLKRKLVQQGIEWLYSSFLRNVASEVYAIEAEGIFFGGRTKRIIFHSVECASLFRPMALGYLSPKILVNWLAACFLVGGEIIQSVSLVRKTRNGNLLAASSFGKWPRFLTSLRSRIRKLSVAPVLVEN
jgi:hypothetical protein